MLIGARTAMWGGTGWKNPYVTDGLLNMWDGEWNVGEGEHSDANPYGIWYNHGTSATVATLNGGVIGPNYIMNNRSSGDYLATLTNTWSSCGTIELVVRLSNLQSWDAIIVNETRYGGFGLFYFQGYGSNVDHTTEPHIVPPLNTDISLTFVFSSAGAISKIYMNGVEQSGTSVTNNLYQRKEGFIGHIASFARFYNLRMYSQQLTAAEIAANYAIDAARFGLTA